MAEVPQLLLVVGMGFSFSHFDLLLQLLDLCFDPSQVLLYNIHHPLTWTHEGRGEIGDTNGYSILIKQSTKSISKHE